MNGTASGKEAMAHAQFRTKDLISDLAQLETLHDEADKLKCIGNKQMAQQDYEKALESYSKAIQLSPSGPQSHVFYSNRAAACLSLKNYAEAVHDATRSTVLNPEFSKGYARLGQALYFSKRYEEAITAYERALELDNGQEGEQSEITLSYLNKARSKLEKRKNKTETSSTSATKKMDSDVTHSPASAMHVDTLPTTPKEQENTQISERNNIFPQTSIPRGNILPQGPVNKEQIDYFHRKANAHFRRKEFDLALKDYNAAISLLEDEFEVDNDQRFQLFIHRSICLCYGSQKRFEEMAVDARAAISVDGTHFAGHSSLGRALFHLRDFEGAVVALTESLSLQQDAISGRQSPTSRPFEIRSNPRDLAIDQDFLDQAKKSLQATLNIQSPSVSNQNALSPSSNDSASKASIPKLKPPRFVPREQAMTSTPNLKRMPKSWPTQYNPTLEDNFLVGPERTLVIHEGGGMGMKLHRGTDGFVRVLSNTVPGGGSTNQRLAPRDGYVEVGDVIREVAGVDLRRPITNPMWGDTVTLIKMTKRPITFVVAPEVSTPPLSVKEEMLKTHKQNSMEQNLLRKPSNHTVMINSSNKERGVEPVPSSPAIDERPVKLFFYDNMLQNANVFQMKSFHSCKSDDDEGGGNSKVGPKFI